MKFFFVYLMITVLLSVLTGPILSQAQISGKKSATPVTNSSIPDDLKEIFKNSCMHCHASGGKTMAMAKLNFSNWDKYKPAKQVKKAVAICKMISKEAMPPKSFREKYPNDIPTASQKDKICKWSNTLALKK